MREIITFTEDELVQMLEGGEVGMPMASIAGGQTNIIFKMEEKKPEPKKHKDNKYRTL